MFQLQYRDCLVLASSFETEEDAQAELLDRMERSRFFRSEVAKGRWQIVEYAVVRVVPIKPK